MNIAYILPSLANMGPIVVAKDLVSLMVNNGHNCTVFYFDNKTELSFACETIRIDLLKYVNLKGFDIVHAHGFRPQLYVSLHRSFKSKTKYIATMHNFLFQDMLYTYGKLRGLIYSFLFILTTVRFDMILVLSNLALSYYRRFISKKKLFVTYNTRIIDTHNHLKKSEIEELEKIRKDAKYIAGTICKVCKRKGLDIVIKSLPQLPSLKFVIVGDGDYKEELRKLSEKLGVSNRVLFLGYKDNAFRYNEYFDFYFMPSHSEGFPLSLLEAAYYGKATIASNIPLFKEIFGEDEIVMFDLEKPLTLIEAFNKAVINKQTLEFRIKRKYDECYSPKAFYNLHIQAYEMNNHSYINTHKN